MDIAGDSAMAEKMSVEPDDEALALPRDAEDDEAIPSLPAVAMGRRTLQPICWFSSSCCWKLVEGVDPLPLLTVGAGKEGTLRSPLLLVRW